LLVVITDNLLLHLQLCRSNFRPPKIRP